MNNQLSKSEEQIKEEKQKAFLEQARKGVLKFIHDKGGKLSLAEMHDYSMNRYLIQHQSFSKMMEAFVGEGYVEYDALTQDATLTEAGRQFITVA